MSDNRLNANSASKQAEWAISEELIAQQLCHMLYKLKIFLLVMNIVGSFLEHNKAGYSLKHSIVHIPLVTLSLFS